MVPRHAEEELLNVKFERFKILILNIFIKLKLIKSEPLYHVEKEIEMPPVLSDRERSAYYAKYGASKTPKLRLSKFH